MVGLILNTVLRIRKKTRAIRSLEERTIVPSIVCKRAKMNPTEDKEFSIDESLEVRRFYEIIGLRRRLHHKIP